MRSSIFSPVPILAALLLVTGCARPGRPLSAVQPTGPAVPESMPATDLQRRALAGRWRMEAKVSDALVPNVILVLHPDGELDFLRDEGGGTNFSLQFSGTWTASSPAPDQVQIALDFVRARPERLCYPLPGTCVSYSVPFGERWTFVRTGPETMETPGAVWHRGPLSVADAPRDDPATSRSPSDPTGARAQEPIAPGRMVASGAPRRTKSGADGSAPPAAPVEGFAIHLASVSASAEVPGEWRRLARRFPDLADLRQLAPQAVDGAGKGTFYRVLGGPFATRGEAQAACARLRAQGASCEVVPRPS